MQHGNHGGHGGNCGHGHGHSHGGHSGQSMQYHQDGTGVPVNPNQASRVGWGLVPGLSNSNFPIAILVSFVVFFFLLIPFIFDVNLFMRPKGEGQADPQQGQESAQQYMQNGTQQTGSQFGSQFGGSQQQTYTQQPYTHNPYAHQYQYGQSTGYEQYGTQPTATYGQQYAQGSQQLYVGPQQQLQGGQLYPHRQSYEQRGQKVQVYVNR